MTGKGSLLPDHPRIRTIKFVDGSMRDARDVVLTREHDVIREWAEARDARPATGEATSSGPATLNVNDGGAGVRFNFPAAGVFRPISWEEWFSNFDRYECAFLFEKDSSLPLSNRYRIVKARDWSDQLY